MHKPIEVIDRRPTFSEADATGTTEQLSSSEVASGICDKCGEPISIHTHNPETGARGCPVFHGATETTDQASARGMLEEVERRRAMAAKVIDVADALAGKTGFKPAGARVLVLPLPPSETFDAEGALVKPDIAKERPAEGILLELGSLSDVELRELAAVDAFLAIASVLKYAKRGAHVCYGKFSGTEVVIDGIEMVLLQVDEILGIRARKGQGASDAPDTPKAIWTPAAGEHEPTA